MSSHIVGNSSSIHTILATSCSKMIQSDINPIISGISRLHILNCLLASYCDDRNRRFHYHKTDFDMLHLFVYG